MRMRAPISVFLLRLPENWQAAQDRTVPPAWLCSDDSVRYRSMNSGRRRAEFAAGRLLLRHAIEACHPGMRWRLVAPQGQLPRLEAEDGGKLATVVSIAHSAGLIAIALSDSRRLGVDLERRGARKRDLAEVAGATLHPLELAEMASLPAPARRDFFLRLWTLKEALAKALGEGLSLPMREFAFAGDALVAAPASWNGMHERWRFANPLSVHDAALGLAWTESDAQAAVPSVREVDHQELAESVAS
jgi:4'-phosphopantetheinyl transferase